MTELETAIGTMFSDITALFTGPIITGVAVLVAVSVGLTLAIRRIRQNAR